MHHEENAFAGQEGRDRTAVTRVERTRSVRRSAALSPLAHCAITESKRRRVSCRISGTVPSWFLVFVELLEDLLHVVELLLGLLDGRLELLQALLLRYVLLAFFILLLAVVLDLLARVFDLAQAESGGRALEEVAELGERLEVLLLAVLCQQGRLALRAAPSKAAQRERALTGWSPSSQRCSRPG